MKPYTFNFLGHGSNHMTVQQIRCELERRGLDVVIVSDDEYCDKHDVSELIQNISAMPFQSDEDNPRHRICLLYKDSGSRLYNVTLTGGGGLSKEWETTDATFGGLQAVVAIILLARVLSYSSKYSTLYLIMHPRLSSIYCNSKVTLTTFDPQNKLIIKC